MKAFAEAECLGDAWRHIADDGEAGNGRATVIGLGLALWSDTEGLCRAREIDPSRTGRLAPSGGFEIAGIGEERPMCAGVSVWLQHTIPKPRHDDGGSFATAGRNLDELRFASCASAQGLCVARLSIRTAAETALISERRRQTCALLENREQVGAAHSF
jgi:hypothetical protein